MRDTKMKQFAWLLLPVLLLASCTSAPQSSPNVLSPQTGGPTAVPIKKQAGPLSLTIFSPADQAVVSSPQVELRGDASEAGVLTVNDNTYVLNGGPFTEIIPLQEGLNSVQIVASDMSGNEIDLILTVTYQP